MKTFQTLCQEKFENIKIMARGGQKVVYSGIHKVYGDSVIKLYFQLTDPRSLREIEIEKRLDIPMIPKIYESGVVEYDDAETLYIIEQKINGTELRQLLSGGMLFTLKEAVNFLEQRLRFIICLEKEGIVHRDIKPENSIVSREAFRHYLFCLRKQCQSSVRTTYQETKDAHLVMLETAEQLLSGLSEKGIKGQNGDFSDIVDVNRAAISAFDMSYKLPLTREWDGL